MQNLKRLKSILPKVDKVNIFAAVLVLLALIIIFLSREIPLPEREQGFFGAEQYIESCTIYTSGTGPFRELAISFNLKNKSEVKFVAGAPLSDSHIYRKLCAEKGYIKIKYKIRRLLLTNFLGFKPDYIVTEIKIGDHVMEVKK